MRMIRLVSLGFLAVVLISCAVPGGIYKGYEGPDRDVTELAVLTWSRPDVTHIDGKDVQEEDPFLTGIKVTIAHLPPGRHRIAISHFWEDLYYEDPGGRYLNLQVNLQVGQSYVVREAPCMECDPFSVVFWVADAVTGMPLSQTTMIGSGPYGEAEKEAEREEIEECEEECSDEGWDCRSDDEKSNDECWDDERDCKRDCDPIGYWFPFN